PRYRPEYGNRTLYNGGYKEGFLAGYGDSVEGRDFRAVGLLRELATGVNPQAAASAFDSGFSVGYQAGVNAALSSPRAVADFGFAATFCRTSLQSYSGNKSEYCDAYGRGYHLGYSDGQLR